MKKGIIALVIVVVAAVCFTAGFKIAPAEVVREVEVTKEVPTKLKGEFYIGYVQCDPTEADLDYGGYDIAIDDINSWLRETGREISFKRIKLVGDGTPTKTVEQFEAAVAAGSQAVVGISWSAHVTAMKARADALKVPLISVYSTAVGLAIPGDYIFRIVPTTAPYGALVREYCKALGLKAAVIAYADEPFGKSYYEAVKSALKGAGIEIAKEVPLDIGLPEWTAEFGTIKDAWKTASATYGKDKVLVVIPISGPKGVPAMQSLERYPELAESLVFMSNAPNTEWVVHVPKICAKTKTTTMHMTHPANPTQAALAAKSVAKGYKVKPHLLQAYDCTWIAALSILAAGEYKGESIAKWIPVIANSYFGATGYCRLNEAGDRATVDFTIMRVVEISPGTYDFVEIGYYAGAKEELTLTL